MNKIECCHWCKDRDLGCHSSCKTYLDEKKKLDELRKKEKDEAFSAPFARKEARTFKYTTKSFRKKGGLYGR